MKRFEALLGHDPHDAAAMLAGLLDSAMDGIITMDAQHCVILYNRAAERIFGWPREDVIGGPLHKLLPSQFKAGHESHVARFGETGVTSRRMGALNVIKGLRASGEEFPMDASISQLDTDRGKIYTVILRDVTERVRAQEELSAFATAAHAIREGEKTRVARELHDELAQSLTALKMDAMWVADHLGDAQQAQARLAGMIEMVDHAVASTRRISADLRPLLLDDLGLVAAIEWLVDNFRQRHGIDVQLLVDEDLELPEPHATAVFRIVQETLSNVAKHAQATHVRIAVSHAGRNLVLRMSDNGRGFALDLPRKPASLGLLGLRERVQLVKGQVDIRSAPGEGTRIEVRIPLDAAQVQP